MDRFLVLIVSLFLLFVGARSQLVCYSCSDCGSGISGAVSCGGWGTGNNNNGGYPTLPTTPAPTYPTQTLPPLATWYPTLATIPPWPRARNYGYVCYRIQRYVPSEWRYVYDRGCALQLASYETTCHSITGNQGYQHCEFCTSSLCNY